MLWWLSSARSRRRVWLRLSARCLKSKISPLKTQKHLYCLVFTKTVLSKLLETVFICGKLGELKPDLTTTAHFAIQLSDPMSYLQHFLQARAGGLFVLVEGVGIDIQRGGGLTVAEDARHRGHIRAARDHQIGGGVPEGMDVQLLRQAVLLEDQLEAVGEGGGRHRELRSLTAEQEVIGGQLPLVIGFGDVCTFLPVLPQETFHLGGEVHIAVTCAGLGFFDEDLLVCHLDRVAADVDGTLLPINVAPLQSAALAPPHPRGDDELEVGFVLDALALQRGDDFLRRFLVRDLLFTFASGVAVGAPSRIMRKKATLHGIREDAAQRSVHALNGVLGEWLFRFNAGGFSQLRVEIPEVLRSQLGELVVTQRRCVIFNRLHIFQPFCRFQKHERDPRKNTFVQIKVRRMMDA